MLTNETASDGVNNKRRCPIKVDNILGAWVRQLRVVEICPMVCFAAQPRIVKQFKFSYWNCLLLFRARKKGIFWSEIRLTSDLAWPVVYLVVRTIMSTSMFLLLLLNVLCFAQNLRFTRRVSCALKSSEFKEVCHKTFLRRSSCCVVFWN